MKNIKEQIMKICKSDFPEELNYIYTHIDRYTQSYDYIRNYIKPNSRILDIGSNNNGSTFIKLIRDNFDCIIESHNNDLRYPFNISSDKYDLIICMEIIEHIKDRNSEDIAELSQFNWNGMDNLMSEMYRCLKSGGHLFLTTPNACSYDCIIKILSGKNPNHYIPHVKEFTYEELIEYVKKFNFIIEKSETIDSWSSEKFKVERTDIINFLRSFELSTDNRLQNTFCIGKKL